MALWLVFLLLLTRSSATYYRESEESRIVLDRQIKGNITQLNSLSDHELEILIDLNQHCRLTQHRKSQAGYLSSHRPLTSTQFQIDVELSIGGTDDTLFGDGLAIWLIEEGIKNTGPVFGAPDHWKGLGIFIDTFANIEKSLNFVIPQKPFPRMMGILNDGSKQYDLDHNGQGQESGECHVPKIRDKGIHTVRINYLRYKFLEVLVSYDDPETASDEAVWSHCFTIFDIALPIRPYVAFSALTGDLADTHDIVSVYASQIHYQPEPLKFTPTAQPRVQQVKSSGVWSLLYMCHLERKHSQHGVVWDDS
ncbi:legume-like lectin family-domain-containing protein [Melampsora americana]|nr:legume-like lectin family-domain-containing protein [Melampsora americana]